MKQMTFLDLCSGIGGFRLGLETAGHKCIGYCEYDKFARASYEAMYDTEGEWKAHDVTKLKPEDVPYADIWCFGFPCQDISVAGKQRGLVGKRSGIYYNIIDLLKGKEESAKPAYLLVENVKNLLSINAGFDFASVLSEMDEAGYDCRWQVLNSKNFGVPQNRERVFIIANLRSRGRREILPLTGENAAALNQLIGGMQGYRVYTQNFENTKAVVDYIIEHGGCDGVAFLEEDIIFAGFRYPLDSERYLPCMELAAAMVKKASEQKRVNPKATVEQNEKYYMRAWLVNLGFGGKEGKEVRNFFLKHLKGHTAFRTPADAEKWKANRRAERGTTVCSE